MMTQNYKKVTEVRFKHGGSIQVTLAEGEKIRLAKQRGTGSVVLQNYNNRLIDVAMIADIEDVSVMDNSFREPETDSSRLLASKPVERATPTSPGYIRFIVGTIKFNLVHGGRDMTKNLSDEQKQLVNEALEAEGVEYRL